MREGPLKSSACRHLQGICKSGADVLDIGLSGTEQVYATVSAFSADAGVEVTASHNPIDYNGMKIVKKGSKPLSDIEICQYQKVCRRK